MRFTEILLAATLITGLIWLLDRLFWRPKRMINVFHSGPGAREVKEPILVEYAKAFFPILLIVLILRSFIAEPFRIPSGSMRPTLLEGDFILVNKFDYGLRLPFSGTLLFDYGNPKRGDVIVFKHDKRGESMDMIKRVVGLPGDRVEYKDKRIYINGEPVKEEFVRETLDKDVGKAVGWPVRLLKEDLGDIRHEVYVQTDYSAIGSNNDITVPENSYFVMGDNRDNSDDSRFWGFVKEEDILGRAMGIWMSWNSEATGLDCLTQCIRWGRIGNGLGEKIGDKTKAE